VRFTCDKCSAKYTVADEKVRGKVVAVRCTRCGNKITVSGKALLAVPPEDETRVASIDVEALRATIGVFAPGQDAIASGGPPAAAPVPGPISPDEGRLAPAISIREGWYVIVGGVQQGPVEAGDLQAHIAAGRVGPRTYIWRDGQGDWKRANDVPEFLPLFALAPAVVPATAPAPPPSPVDASAVAGVDEPAAVPKNGAVSIEELAAKSEGPASEAKSEPAPDPEQSPTTEAPPAAAQPPVAAEAPIAPTAESATAPAAAAAEVPSDVQLRPLDRLLFEGEVASPPSSAGRPIDPSVVTAGALERKTAVATDDPFAAVPDSPTLSKPGEIGEQTRFFINQSGVNRRNPPWKIALAVGMIIGLPVAVLYGLSQMKIVQLEITRVDEATGAEVKTSVFSSEGVSGLKDILLGTKKRPEAGKKPTPSGSAVAQGDRKPAPGARAEADDPRIQRPKIDFGGPMNDAQREKAAEIYKGGGVLNLDGPKVRSDKLQDKPAVDGKAGLEPAVIAETIGKNSKAFQTCVETELRRNPGFKGGKVLITANLKPSGIVIGSSINKPEIDGSTVGACLKEKARRMVFPAFEGDPFDVEIPLVLTAGE
jgi:predicted Zn finger-like uncharacterized protein